MRVAPLLLRWMEADSTRSDWVSGSVEQESPRVTFILLSVTLGLLCVFS
jgi:hypothetical protein